MSSGLRTPIFSHIHPRWPYISQMCSCEG
jgi:hypothetical protein